MLLFPRFIIRLRKPTGTGNCYVDGDVSASAAYSRSVHEKYLRFLQAQDSASFLQGKTILEIGPGDSLGVAFLFLANGAEQVICIDRFPLLQDMHKNTQVAKLFLKELPEQQGKCFLNSISFDGKENVVWDNSRLRYCCSRKGAIPVQDKKVDLVVSNAVLEHVSKLDELFCELSRITKPGALMVHAADLGPHQLNLNNPLDFLLMPEWLWQLMTSQRGAPNRARKSYYENILKKYSFEILQMEVTERFSQKDVDAILRHNPRLLKIMSWEDIACKSILFCAKRS